MAHDSGEGMGWGGTTKVMVCSGWKVLPDWEGK